MLLAKILIIIQSAMAIIYGIILAQDPGSLAAYMGLGIINNDGFAELITMYVGMSGTEWLKMSILFWLFY